MGGSCRRLFVLVCKDVALVVLCHFATVITGWDPLLGNIFSPHITTKCLPSTFLDVPLAKDWISASMIHLETEAPFRALARLLVRRSPILEYISRGWLLGGSSPTMSPETVKFITKIFLIPLWWCSTEWSTRGIYCYLLRSLWNISLIWINHRDSIHTTSTDGAIRSRNASSRSLAHPTPEFSYYLPIKCVFPGNARVLL